MLNKKNGLSEYRQKKIMWAFAVDLTATQTAHLLGLDRKTVNRYYGLFRAAIHAHQRRQIAALIGVVECDESYFGQARPRGVPVFTEIVPDVKAKTLQGLIRGKVSLESVVMTDGWQAYDGLVDVGYDK